MASALNFGGNCACGEQTANGEDHGAKKEPPFPAAFEVDNREASNRVDRSHSVSKEDADSHS
jgi:hypothetical protein